MSVVNKMLNDLEKRESSVTSHANYQPPAKRPSRLLWFLLSLLVVIILVLAWLLFDTSKKQVLPTSNKEAVTEVQTQPIVEEHAEPQPVPTLEPTDEQTAEPEVAQQQEANATVPESTTAENEGPETQPQVTQAVYNNKPSQPDMAAVESVVPEQAAPITTEPQAEFSVSASSQRIDPPQYKVLVADAVASNQQQKAKDLLKRWITAEPQNLSPRKKLAAMAFASGQLIQAEQALKQAQQLAPDDESIRLMQARLYRQSGKTEAAWQALQLDSQNSDLLHYRAAFARETGQIDRAQADYQFLTRLNNTDLRAWLGLAVVSEQLGDRQLATRAYSQVLSLADSNPEIQAYAQQQLLGLTKQQQELD